jgi:hypothetical protein
MAAKTKATIAAVMRISAADLYDVPGRNGNGLLSFVEDLVGDWC